MSQRDRTLIKVPIMVNDDQHLLGERQFTKTENELQNHKACAVESRFKRVSSFTV